MNSQSDQAIDLEAYFSRIGYTGSRRPDLATLRALHLAHVTQVPFENLDIHLGRPIQLEVERLEAKLVRERRGGYCFEQNGFFSAVLEQMGFKLTRLLARVRLGARSVSPRTHMVLAVEAAGGVWLADVGFGGWGLLEPIPLVAGPEERQGLWTVSLRREGELWVLQCPQSPAGLDQYAFTLEPQLPVDYVVPSYFCSRHPTSKFVLTLTAQLPGLTRRTILKDRELITADGDGVRSEIVAGDEAMLEVLRERFDLVFPPGTVFRSPVGGVGKR